MSDMNTYKHHDGRVFRISDASDTKPSDDEIQRLRAERDESHSWRRMRDDKELIKRLREERDEARQEVCIWQGLNTGNTARDTAKIRGWDCYKNETGTTGQTPNAMADLCGWDLFDDMS